MKTITNALSKFVGVISSYSKIVGMILFSMVFVLSVSSAQFGGGTAGTNISSTLCNVEQTVMSVVFVLGLTLMVLGGAMYAAAHILPGNFKGALTGYGMGMIIGGIAGLILSLMGPYVIQLISGSSVSCP
ncbi:MAG: hypothetical protein M1382_02095 [Candidatus Marsarchaeota archaeon]|jgi:hypothetical protein|nr:hypothetical protein [Candidatus Marsarchaeota archaeon]